MIVKKFHFSIDDVFDTLIDASISKISIKQHPFYENLLRLSESYGVSTGLNVFYQGKKDYIDYDLGMVKDFYDDLKGGWLKFAPHALNFDSPPYTQEIGQQEDFLKKTYLELDRIAGKSNRSQGIRLHYYSEAIEMIDLLKKYGVSYLFTTDKPIYAHRLNEFQINEIRKNGYVSVGGMLFVRTDFRVEDIANKKLSRYEIAKIFEKTFYSYDKVVLYAHEYEYRRKDIYEYTNLCIDILVRDLRIDPCLP